MIKDVWVVEWLPVPSQTQHKIVTYFLIHINRIFKKVTKLRIINWWNMLHHMLI